MKPKLSVTDIQFIWNDRNVFSISNCYTEMLAQRYDTVGKPSENVNVRIKHPNSEGHGELLIKGNNVMNVIYIQQG